MGGKTFLDKKASTSRNARSSTTKVALGTRKLVVARSIGRLTFGALAGGEHEDEEHGHDQVDEVHAFNQGHDEEHRRVEAPLDLGLASNAGDGGATGQTVTNRGSHGAAAQSEPDTDEST